MQQNTRNSLSMVVSLVIAAVVALALAHLREQTSKRPEPFSMPVAQAR